MISNDIEYQVSKAWITTLEREVAELESGQPRLPETLRVSRIHAARDVIDQLRRDIAAWEAYLRMEDQQAPIPRPELTPVWELVMRDVAEQSSVLGITPDVMRRLVIDMLERDQLGRSRYGTPLTAGNGRKHLIDAYQEALDTVVYLRADIAEGCADTMPSYKAAIRLLMLIRALVDQRGLG